MRKHLIIEGMDGSGKDTLISQLVKGPASHFQLHERASTSLGGPVSGLAEWVSRDMLEMEHSLPQIYNRHPLISEPFYSKVRTLPVTEDRSLFHNRVWMQAMNGVAAKYAVLVICQPPYFKVRDTIRKQGIDAHMPGVYDNTLNLYTDYASLVWPGATIRYDYTISTPEALWATVEKAFEWGARTNA